MATMFKSDLPKRVRVKNRTASKARAARRRKLEAVKRDVYALVDERDKGHCRGCGNWLGANGIHHHHIVYRSQGGQHTTANVVTLCFSCHHNIHAGKLTVSGSADETLLFCEYRNDAVKGWQS